MDRPETLYVDSGGTSIAYQEFGEGPETLVVVGALLNHIEMMWEVPVMARHMRQLGSFAHVVFCDRRGIGQSDRLAPEAQSTIAEHVGDIESVVEATGDRAPNIFAFAEGCAPAMVFAAEHPDRVSKLVLYAASARFTSTDGYSLGVPAELLPFALDFETWGDASNPWMVDVLTPSMAADPEWRSTLARLQRLAGSPASAQRFFEFALAADVRESVPLVQCPTLLLHVTRDQGWPVSHARWIAERMPNATLRELTGTDFFYFFENADVVAAEIEQFLIGTSGSGSYGRELATILFADIVDSTQIAAEHGMRAWREKLDLLDKRLTAEINRHAGRLVKHLGDGILASFSIPSAAVDFAQHAHEIAAQSDLQLRVGVHLGEVERNGGDLIGPGVNVAARIQSASQPGHTLVSQAVREAMYGHGIDFSTAGSYELKGIARPWTLYEPDQASE